MKKPLKVLFVDDNAEEVAPMIRALTRSGYKVSSLTVAASRALSIALDKNSWDIVIADHTMKKFDGSKILKAVGKLAPDLPLILVSTQAGEKAAIGLLKDGADDFVAKSDLGRLGSVVERELREAERKRESRLAGETLLNNSRWLEMALDAADLGIWDWNLATNEVVVNERWLEMTGYRRHEIQPLHTRFFDELVCPDDRDRLREIVKRNLDGETERYDAEFRITTKSGGIRWIHSRGQTLERDAKGRPLRMVGTHRDITESKLAEKSLRASEERFRALFENLNVAATLFEPILDQNGVLIDLRYLVINSMTERAIGVKRHEVEGRLYSELFSLSERNPIFDIYEKVAANGEPFKGELYSPALKGYYDMSIYRPSENRLAVLFTDITEHLEAEQALKESENHFRSLFEHMINGFVLYEILYAENGSARDARYIDVNPAFEKMMGMKRGEVIGRTLLEVFPKLDPARIKEYEQAAAGGGPITTTRDRYDTGQVFDVTIYSPRSGYVAIIFQDVTERRLADEKIRASEERYRTLFEQMLNGFALHEMIFDSDGKPVDYRFLEVNSEFERLTGLRAADVVGKTVRQAVPDIEPFWIERYGKVVVTGEPIRFEGHSAALGKYYEAKAFRPTPGKFAVVFDDITERKQAEDAIAGLATFPEENPNPVLRITTDNKIMYANPIAAELLGCWRTEIGGSLPDYVFAKVMEEWSSDMKRDFELECGGRLYWFRAVRIAEREYISIYAKDITELKNAEKALRENEERFRVALKAADITVFNTDKNLRYTWMYDPRLAFSVEEALGRRDDELMPAENARQLVDVKQKVIDTGVGTHEEVEVIRQGQKFVYDIVAEPLKDENGELLGLTAATFEITRRKQMEEALWRINELLETMFFSIEFHLAYLDRDMNIIRVNRAYAAANKHLPEYFVGKNHFVLFPHEENEKIFREVVANGKPYHVYAKPFAFPEHPEWGTTYWDWSLQPVFERDGSVGGLILSLNDVTKREKAVQEVARKNEALATANNELRQFAYIASHDLQEPLRMIASYLQLIEKRYKDRLDSDANEFIAFAVDGATRLQNMINSLLEYSRIETRGAELKLVSCEAPLKQALSNLSLIIKESGAEVTFEPLPAVRADGLQLIQLFQNLIGNALKFRREETPRIRIGAMPGREEWIFEVRDNGIGIELQHFDRVFNIFQRLHGHDYPGTGIGLALCKRIVERHDGKIWIESTPGQGSAFFFTLPSERPAGDAA